MKTKTKKKLKSHLPKLLKRGHKILRRKPLKKKAAQRLLRGFFIFVMTACTGSLFLAVATAKPTVDPNLRARFSTHSVTVDAATGKVMAGGSADQVGLASWYALGLPQPEAQTCASRTFPRGTFLEVRNLRNGTVVTCLVNDYGPETWTGRVIDMSLGSARVLQMVSSGTTSVEIRVVPAPNPALNLALPKTFSALTGYGLCQARFTKDYCESHRQNLTWP